MSNKKDRMKTSKLSSTVLDYYYKYGQNRDLEKYLRLKRQSTSKSSSDSSLKNYAGADSPTLDCKRITKSMEKLNLSDRKIQFADEDDDQNEPQSGDSNKPSASINPECNESSRDKSKEKQKSNESQPIKIEKKTQQQWKSKSKSKSYNFNMESSIEINLPTTNSMPVLPVSTQTIDIDSSEKQFRIAAPQLESSETQTDTNETEPGPSNLKTPCVEQKVKSTAAAAAATVAMTVTPTPEIVQETSPASSVASAAKSRLEWDSMADIGYNRFIDFKSQSNSNLTTFERSALTKFFAKRGLNFDDNLVILAPPTSSTTIEDNKSPLQRRKFTQSAIEMREAQKIRADLTASTKKLSPTTDKQLWERALLKYREKYGQISSKLHKSRNISANTGGGGGGGSSDTTQFTVPPHHSTPFPSDMSKTSQYSMDESSDRSKNTPIKIDDPVKQQPIKLSSPPPTPPQRIEKWCQTSLIGVEAIGIQVEQQQPQIQHVSKSVQIEIEQVHESTQKDDDDLTMATSFEFLAPSAYSRNQDEMIGQIPSNNNAIPAPMELQNIPTCHDNRYENIYIQDENPDDKENIPPIDDKENIPPLPPSRPFPTRAMPQHTEQLNVFKTPPDQSIVVAAAAAAAPKPNGGDGGTGGDSSVLSNDLQIGVDLINALIDSRGTNAATKKKLIRKIVRHLLRSKDTKDITQMIMSYTTEKSNSKISGVSTLIDEDEKSDGNNSKVDQMGKDTISGISTLDSSSSNVSRAASIEPHKMQSMMQSNSGEDEQKRSGDCNVESKNSGMKTDNMDQENELKDRRKKDIENCGSDLKGVKEWLLPMTQSEIEKEITRKQSRSQQNPSESAVQNSKLNALQIENDDQSNSQMDDNGNQQIEFSKNATKNAKSTRSNEILDQLETEKKTQFDWIDQEIEHLKNLKKLLKQINASESDEQSSIKGGNISDEKTNSVYAKHINNRDYFTIYENFRRTRKQHKISGSNGSQADESSTLIDTSKSSENSSKYHGKMGSKSHWIHKTTLESPPSTISSGSKFKPIDHNEHLPSPQPSSLIRTGNNNRAHLAQWDSHLNMQQLVKNRTKLKTPNSDSDSIEAYAKACRTKFERKCAKSQNQGKGKYRSTASASALAVATTKALIKTISERDQPIYTKPYSSDSYSDVRQSINERSGTGHGHHLKGKQQTDIIAADAYTSVTGSDGFLSPNSISIGVAANSTSNTTTHQYDTKISIGLQTTDTLQRMPIIQLRNPIETVNEPIEQTPRPQTTAAAAAAATATIKTTTTMRVNKFTVNKQLQVRPESLAYIIVFKDNDAIEAAAVAADENANSMGQERGNQLYANSKRKHFMQRHWNTENSSNSSGSSSISDVPKQNSKEQLKSVKEHEAIDSNRGERPISNSSSGSSFENLTLQEYLQAHRPDFYANAEQRRKCLNNLHNLRQQRNEQRKKLLATNISGNAKMLNRNMKRLLPPPPLAQMRIFKSREIISQTRRKYQKLPEIQQRQQMERDMKIRRNHRMLVNVFSKNLQKHVLSGKTDLSNSMMIN